MKKVLFWLIIGVMFSAIGCNPFEEVPEEAETKGNISGRVTADNGIAVADAAIELVGYGQNRTTGTTGQYVFYDLESGSYQLKISKKNYDEKTVDVVVNGGSTTTKNITLISSYGTISGTVTDAESNMKLAGVTVALSGKTTITTDANGYYQFTNLSSGSFTVSFSMTGYQDKDLNVEVSAGSVTQGNVQLKKSSIAVNTTTLNFGNSISQHQLVLTGEASEEKGYTIFSNVNWINISDEDKGGSVSKTNPKTIIINVDRSSISNGEHDGQIFIVSDGVILHTIGVIISKGYIKLLSPNGNEKLILKGVATISWETNLTSATTVELYKSGTFVENIRTNVNEKSISWSVRKDYPAASDYKIKISNGTYFDESDANFSIIEQPVLGINPEILDFGYDKTTINFTLTNTGTGSLNWELAEKISWLTITNNQTTGSLMADKSIPIEAVVNRANLPKDNYDGNIQFSYNGNTKDLPVKMCVNDSSPKPEISLTAKTNSNFREEFEGNKGETRNFIIKNTGDLRVVVNVDLKNNETGNFETNALSTYTLEKGEAKEFTVQFTPKSSGDLSAILEASGTDIEGKTINLSGTGKYVATKIIDIQKDGKTISTLDFNDVDSGVSAQKIITIKNNGNTDFNITNISVPNGYTINRTSGTVTAKNLENFTITFNEDKKLSRGSYSGNLSISTEGGVTGNKTLSLNGKIAVRELKIEPNSLEFGNVIKNDANGIKKTFTITSSGNSPVTISNLGVPNGYTYSTNGYSLNQPLTAPVTVDVIFKPTSVASYNGNITINSDAMGGNNQITLTGAGVEAGFLSDITGSSSNFGNIESGYSSGEYTFNISNNGGSDIENLVVSLSNASDFQFTSGGGNIGTLSKGQTHQIKVKFAPPSNHKGQLNSTLKVYNSNFSKEIELKGFGAFISAEKPGDEFIMGNSMTVNWDTNLDENFKIQLYDYNNCVKEITTSSRNKSARIDIPSNIAISEEYEIRIYSTSNSSINDYSDEFLITKNPKAEITSDGYTFNSTEQGKTSSDYKDYYVKNVGGKTLVGSIYFSGGNYGDFNIYGDSDNKVYFNLSA